MAHAASGFLNLRLLYYWVVVVDEGSITAAARRLSIPQPSLSQQVRKLEEFMGGTLLERLPGGVRLTAAGRVLLPEARAILAAAESARGMTGEALGLEAGVLEIATYHSLAAGALLSSIRSWYERHPRVPLRIREFTHQGLSENVGRGIGDLGIGNAPSRWSGPLVHIGWEEFVVVLSPDDPACDATSVSLESLATRAWVLYERALGLAELAQAAFTHAGFQPRVAVETSGVEAAARLAAIGLGPALVPAKNVPRDVAWAVRRLAVPPVWEIAAFTRGAWSSGAEAYAQILREESWAGLPDGAVVLTLQ